jgi:osmotically inducible protein OsmC
MIRKATAVWNGGGKDGTGNLTTASGVLKNASYGAKSRFDEAPGTNPEELLAAAHAGCFTMALAFQLEKEGHPAQELRTEAAVSLGKDGDGFRINKSELTLVARVPGIDASEFDRIARSAKEGCPVSKLFNAQITLEATLA